MSEITRLYLFIHPMPRKAETRERYMPLWEELITREGRNAENAICVLSNADNRFMRTLNGWAQDAFGDRCILDPIDEGPETQVLLAEDLRRTFGGRGSYTEWIPYEIWTSSMARKWTEGLKRELQERGHTYEPEALTVEACGQQWAGCLAKYSIFMPKYLGATKTTDTNAALSPDAGWPLKAEFVERIAMDRQVWLFLFRTADGLPMAQYMDGLRAVWEPPHVVAVSIDPKRVEVVTSSPNRYLEPTGKAQVLEGAVVMDVGDGCHPAFTTLIGRDVPFDEFRDALAAGQVAPRQDRSRVQYGVPAADPITSTR